MSDSQRWVALNNQDYRWLWISSLLAFVSVQGMVVPRTWLAWELTESNFAIGGVMLAMGIPLLIVTPFGGVAADRFPKKRLLLVASAVIAVGAILVGVAVATDVVEYWMLVVNGFVQGSAFAVFAPTRVAFASEMLGPSQIANGIVLQQLALNGSRVVAPSTAGLLIGVDAIGIGGTYLLFAAVMTVSLLTTFLLPDHQGSREPAQSRPSPLSEIRAGIAHVRERPALLRILVTSTLVIMTSMPFVALLPDLVDTELRADSDAYGTLLGASAVGAVGAALYAAGRASGSNGRRLIVAGGFVGGASTMLLAYSTNIPMAALVIVATGFSTALFQAASNTLAIEAADPDFHGRVQSLIMLGFSAFGLISLPLGAVADALGVRETLALMGAATMTWTVGYVLSERRWATNLRDALTD